MRIGYVAKHDSGGNDDEGAITHALLELGHDVSRLREVKGRLATRLECDVLLFHKWCEPDVLKRVRVPKVFWYFDLVDYPDKTLEGRNRNRREWMRAVMPLVDLGFCTDGDWVTQDTSGKLVWLPQGADGRIAGPAVNPACCPLCDSPWSGAGILFAGDRNGGRGREDCIADLERVYGPKFRIVNGMHGRDLANVIAGTKIVIAPNAPVTDRYWSNRVYITTGFRGFMLHPWAAWLKWHHFFEETEVCFYKSRDEMHDKIQYYLKHHEEREAIAQAGHARTMRDHLYKNRCAQLISVIQTRLGIQ